MYQTMPMAGAANASSMGLRPNEPPNPVWNATKITKPQETADTAATQVMTGSPANLALDHPGACACSCGRRQGVTAAAIDTMMNASASTAMMFSRNEAPAW